MEPHTDAEIQAFASELEAHGITDAYFYVSYLKTNDQFNLTYDHASNFVRVMRDAALDIALWGWVGVPIQVTQADGQVIPNRLEEAAIRQMISQFANVVVDELGFDGIHLNAELIANDDESYLELLRLIRSELPSGARLSIAAHALRVTEPILSIPYPVMNHHWTPAYLQQVAALVDQIAMMFYDSGLFTPQDYRTWTTYQVLLTLEALAEADTEIMAGFSASEEWTSSHHPDAENLANALIGLRIGLSEASSSHSFDGIALYPYWETSEEEWLLMDGIPGK